MDFFSRRQKKKDNTVEFMYDLDDLFRNKIKIRIDNHFINHVAIKSLQCLQTYHNKGYVHSDIKPLVFLVDSSNVKLLNFESYKPFTYDTDKIIQKYESVYHIKKEVLYESKYLNDIYKYSKNKHVFIGDTMYASHYTHDGYEQTPRDDLISLSYVLLYLKYGCLPWSFVECRNDEQDKLLIRNMKKYTDIRGFYKKINIQHSKDSHENHTFIQRSSKNLRNASIELCKVIEFYYTVSNLEPYESIPYRELYQFFVRIRSEKLK